MRGSEPNSDGRKQSNSRVFQQLVRMIAGESRQPSFSQGILILLPLVRRTIQTGHGPPALIRWLGRAIAAHTSCDSLDQLASELTAELIRALIGSPDPHAETQREH